MGKSRARIDPMKWAAIFDVRAPERPASATAILQLGRDIGRAVSRLEAAEIRQSDSNPFPQSDPLHSAWRPLNPERWTWPSDRALPDSYLSFLRFSNGGYFETGERVFQMFGTKVRDMMLAYRFPEFAPLAVPFALNGGGVFYFFDMRAPPNARGEYPVLCAPSGALRVDDVPRVAGSFVEACTGRFNVEKLLFEE